LDELPEEEPSDWVVGAVRGCSHYRDDPRGGHSEAWWAAACSASPACLHSDSHHSAARADRCDGPVAAEGYSLQVADWFAQVPECRGGLPDDPMGD